MTRERMTEAEQMAMFQTLQRDGGDAPEEQGQDVNHALEEQGGDVNHALEKRGGDTNPLRIE